eukprot:CAMPEP_0179451718 /NCGR_PEP_ID=MMETSP0799-20121207/35795_1 /TAXON_ID=46947 /ORGANISM="Geminigera cryophila, Strain CCMP2564" /LENGTH=942 /DNA_ID=CAMNT_0021247303 /DNA_START=70 /DNA_END=2898 /DNA_ORIENTATION=-
MDKGAKRSADSALGLPIAKRAKSTTTTLPGWDAALIDHHALSGEIGGIKVEWKALLQPSSPLESSDAASSHGSSESLEEGGNETARSTSCLECASAASRRASPPVFVPSQGRSFASIGEAVRNAECGEVIRLQPGCYVQLAPIILARDGVHIIAAVEDELAGGSAQDRTVTVVSHTKEHDCLVCYANGCEIRGIKMVHSSCAPRSKNATAESVSSTSTPADSARGCVRIETGDLRILQCSISSWSGYGIKVMGSSHPLIESCSLSQCHEVAVLLMGTSRATLRGCHLSHNKCAGVVLLDEAKGQLTSNTIAHNEKCGIVCAGRSSAHVVGNAVLGGNGGGVWIRERSAVVLVENLIALSLKVSLQVSDDSTPVVQNNRISNGCNGGIVVHGCARGVFSDNVVSGHNKAGLGVTDSARPHFVRNSFFRNRAGGAIFTGKSRTDWNENIVEDNVLFGVHVRASASVLAVGGSISLNSGPGLQLQEYGHARVLHTCMHGNTRAGAIAVGHATLELSNCHVRSEAPQPLEGRNHTSRTEGDGASAAEVAQTKIPTQQRIGVQIAGDARVEVASCEVHGHASGNVVVQGRSGCTITDTTITSGTWAGIVLQGSSHTVMSRVCVRDGRSAGVLAMDNAVLTGSNNKFIDGKGVGLLMAGSSRALLARNAIVGNAGTGLMIKERAIVDMRQNRISGNGVHGVTLQGPCSVTASENALFENEGAGIHSLGVICEPSAQDAADGNGGGVPELFAIANVLLSSSNPSSVAAAVEGPIKGLMHGNILDSQQIMPCENLDRNQVENDAHQDSNNEQEQDDYDQLQIEQAEHVEAPAVFAAAHRNTRPTNGSIAFLLSELDTPENDTSKDSPQAPRVDAETEEHEVFGDNVTVSRAELVALLRNTLLPRDCYGPAPREAVQAMTMPDGSISLVVALAPSRHPLPCVSAPSLNDGI